MKGDSRFMFILKILQTIMFVNTNTMYQTFRGETDNCAYAARIILCCHQVIIHRLLVFSPCAMANFPLFHTSDFEILFIHKYVCTIYVVEYSERSIVICTSEWDVKCGSGWSRDPGDDWTTDAKRWMGCHSTQCEFTHDTDQYLEFFVVQ